MPVFVSAFAHSCGGSLTDLDDFVQQEHSGHMQVTMACFAFWTLHGCFIARDLSKIPQHGCCTVA